MFFFFSSRRRHTRLQGDWSSDVCSSDLTVTNRRRYSRRDVMKLQAIQTLTREHHVNLAGVRYILALLKRLQNAGVDPPEERSEERRVGKECRSRWSPYH